MAVIRRRIVTAVVVVALVFGAALAFILATVNTDMTITIGTGPKGTTSYQTAERMRDGLTAAGFTVEIRSTQRTLDLIDELSDPQDPVDVTFIGEPVSAREYPTVESLGTVGRVPFYFATLPGKPQLSSLDQAKGKRIEMGPVGSLRESFAREVLAQFGVTEANSTFLHLSSVAPIEDLEAEQVDLVAARWDDARGYLRSLIVNRELHVIPVPEAPALAGFVRSAEAAVIPYAGFSINPPFPLEPLPTIAMIITVVANENLSPAAAYAIARELTIDYSPGTQFSQPGEFPNFIDRQLPTNQAAADYYTNGSIPWQYTHLPPVLADSFVNLVVLGTALLIIATVYGLFLPEVYGLWQSVIKPRSAERYINEMEAALASGRELTVVQRRRLSEILARQDANLVLRQRADNLRPQLSTPVDDETDNERDPVTGEVLGERRRQPSAD